MPLVLFVGGPKNGQLKKFANVPHSFSVTLDEPYLDKQSLPVTRGTYYQRAQLGRIGLYLYEKMTPYKAMEKIATEWSKRATPR